MTIEELNNKYYFHDSMITNINYLAGEKILIILMDLCNWAQENYKEGEPELLKLEIIFEGIEEYDGITGEIDYFSIFKTDVENGKLHLLIEDDFHQESYEYYLKPTNIVDRIIGIVEDN